MNVAKHRPLHFTVFLAGLFAAVLAHDAQALDNFFVAECETRVTRALAHKRNVFPRGRTNFHVKVVEQRQEARKKSERYRSIYGAAMSFDLSYETYLSTLSDSEISPSVSADDKRPQASNELEAMPAEICVSKYFSKISSSSWVLLSSTLHTKQIMASARMLCFSIEDTSPMSHDHTQKRRGWHSSCVVTDRGLDFFASRRLCQWFQHVLGSLVESLFVSTENQRHDRKDARAKHCFFLRWTTHAHEDVAHETKETHRYSSRFKRASYTRRRRDITCH